MHSKIVVEKLRSYFGHNDCIYSLARGNDPSLFFSVAGDGLVVKWDLANPEQGELIAKVPNSIYALHLLSEQNVLVVGQNYEGIHLLDWQNKIELNSIKLSSAAIFDIKSHKNHLFVASGDGAVTVIDTLQSVILLKIQASQKSARTIAINPFTNDLAVGYSDHSIRIFDLTSFQKKNDWVAHQNSVFTLAYSTDHTTLVSGSRDARIKAWDIQNNYSLMQEVAAHLYAVNHLSYSPDGNYIISGSMDKSVKIWESGELKLLKVVDKARHAGHGTSVNKVLWIDDTHFLSAGDDRVISHWRIEN